MYTTVLDGNQGDFLGHLEIFHEGQEEHEEDARGARSAEQCTGHRTRAPLERRLKGRSGLFSKAGGVRFSAGYQSFPSKPFVGRRNLLHNSLGGCHFAVLSGGLVGYGVLHPLQQADTIRVLGLAFFANAAILRVRPIRI
jgi:hypothetical protein